MVQPRRVRPESPVSGELGVLMCQSPCWPSCPPLRSQEGAGEEGRDPGAAGRALGPPRQRYLAQVAASEC